MSLLPVLVLTATEMLRGYLAGAQVLFIASGKCTLIMYSSIPRLLSRVPTNAASLFLSRSSSQ